jgi:D-serine deaminase-like pyridoxal phosphate-dependent protein
MRDPAPHVTDAHARVRETYGAAIGSARHDLITPALVLDLDILRDNLRFMQSRLPEMPVRVRGHVKNHKSPQIARLQIEHGAFGVVAATIWEAIVMAWTGIDEILVANELVVPAKRRAAALLARQVNLQVCVDDIGDAEALSEEAVRAGSTIGVLVEVEVGLHRCGVDSPEQALALARRVEQLPGLRLEGIEGYEGHCVFELDREKRHALQRTAVDYLVSVADHLRANGVEVGVLSGGGTSTVFWTGMDPRMTEIQLGSYATNDDYHALLEPDFKKATSAVVTVISRGKDRLVLNLGKKTFGSAEVGANASPPGIVGYDLKPYRFDEEHATYEADPSVDLKVGDVVDFHLGYTPYAVNYFEAYHVVEGGRVVDIWPIVPRGPLHHGLLEMLEAEATRRPRTAAISG